MSEFLYNFIQICFFRWIMILTDALICYCIIFLLFSSISWSPSTSDIPCLLGSVVENLYFSNAIKEVALDKEK